MVKRPDTVTDAVSSRLCIFSLHHLICNGLRCWPSVCERVSLVQTLEVLVQLWVLCFPELGRQLMRVIAQGHRLPTIGGLAISSLTILARSRLLCPPALTCCRSGSRSLDASMTLEEATEGIKCVKCGSIAPWLSCTLFEEMASNAAVKLTSCLIYKSGKGLKATISFSHLSVVAVSIYYIPAVDDCS